MNPGPVGSSVRKTGRQAKEKALLPGRGLLLKHSKLYTIPVLIAALTVAGCRCKLPADMVPEHPIQIYDIDQLSEMMTKRVEPVKTAEIRAGMVIKTSRRNRNRAYNLSASTIWFEGDDFLKIRGQKGLLITSLRIFEFMLEGDNLVLVDHYSDTIQSGKASDLQQMKADLALLPPDLGGRRLVFPHPALADNEHATLRKGMFIYEVSVYRADGGRDVLARRFQINRKTLLLEGLQVYDPSGDELIAVKYRCYMWAKLGNGNGATNPDGTKNRIPFPKKISVRVKPKKLSFELVLDKITLNHPRFKRVPITDRELRKRERQGYKVKKIEKKDGDDDSASADTTPPTTAPTVARRLRFLSGPVRRSGLTCASF